MSATDVADHSNSSSDDEEEDKVPAAKRRAGATRREFSWMTPSFGAAMSSSSSLPPLSEPPSPDASRPPPVNSDTYGSTYVLPDGSNSMLLAPSRAASDELFVNDLVNWTGADVVIASVDGPVTLVAASAEDPRAVLRVEPASQQFVETLTAALDDDANEQRRRALALLKENTEVTAPPAAGVTNVFVFAPLEPGGGFVRPLPRLVPGAVRGVLVTPEVGAALDALGSPFRFPRASDREPSIRVYSTTTYTDTSGGGGGDDDGGARVFTALTRHTTLL
jgi:hypothetical protein